MFASSWQAATKQNHPTNPLTACSAIVCVDSHTRKILQLRTRLGGVAAVKQNDKAVTSILRALDAKVNHEAAATQSLRQHHQTVQRSIDALRVQKVRFVGDCPVCLLPSCS